MPGPALSLSATTPHVESWELEERLLISRTRLSRASNAARLPVSRGNLAMSRGATRAHVTHRESAWGVTWRPTRGNVSQYKREEGRCSALCVGYNGNITAAGCDFSWGHITEEHTDTRHRYNAREEAVKGSRQWGWRHYCQRVAVWSGIVFVFLCTANYAAMDNVRKQQPE